MCTTANRQTSMVDFFTLVEKKKKRGRPKGSTAVRRGPNMSRENTGAPNKAAEASYKTPKQSMRGKRKTNWAENLVKLGQGRGAAQPSLPATLVAWSEIQGTLI